MKELGTKPFWSLDTNCMTASFMRAVRMRIIIL